MIDFTVLLCVEYYEKKATIILKKIYEHIVMYICKYYVIKLIQPV